MREGRISLRSSGLRLLSPQFGDTVRIMIDTDRIDALAADRAALWEWVSNAAFLTLNEKREAGGYGR
jgi:phage portal protein BeeE